MNIAELYHLYLQHPVITTDSRNCPPDALFFALKGTSFDGNLFAEKALQTCAYAIIDNPDVKTSDRMIVTDDVLKTLQQLAAYHRKKLGTPIIGITGTNGKTTTKELLAAVLSTKYNLLYTQGNLNNHIGVPLTLLRLTPDHEMAVIEMGANHPGEIHDLVQIVQPDYGIITNVGRAHLEGFGSLEGVIRTKGELYDYLRQTNGKIFIHQENEYLQAIAHGLEQITYGASNEAYLSGQVISSNPFLRFQWRQQDISCTVDTHLVGDYNLWNALASVAAGRYFGVPAEQINRALTAYEPTNNRSQWKKTASNELIIDTYNANPGSMQVALANFAALSATPKAVILGDMRELGAGSLELHTEIVTLLKKQNFDQVFLCGDQFTATGETYRCFPTVEALIDYFSANPLQGFHILIKGSHGVHLEEVVGSL
jgi:UDP-N-acetylmuramoyl-tripeptide--D-alanyl-D-alanine ligase